jgi:hypothetical protein
MKAVQFAGKSRSALNHANRPFVAGGLVGKIGGGLNRIFGCWHTEMSRPFSSDGQAYRTCLSCGARRQFNTRSWKTEGDFYYRLPTSKHFRALNGLAAR